ncbi:MAG: heavy metal translocating P-type ATPase [Chloroflexota bacterium]|nr:heavy metal translocating P-type ATPase [Chloroflexota bacterium]
MTNPTQNEQSQPQRPRWQTQAWLEPRLVVVTALALAGSLIAEQAGAPDWLILALNIASYVAGGFFGAKGAIESLFNDRRVDVDMLMVLAALGAASIDQWHEGAILLFLFSLSNVLQDYAIGRSRQAIKSLMKLYPNEAKVRRDGQVQTLKLDAIRPGDIVLIEPGERIPVDGVIADGRSAVDESPITGESMPVDKLPGAKVFAGTLNKQGALDVRATGAAHDTVLARVIKMVEEAQDTKAPTERFLDKFEQYYAIFILAGVALFIVIPPALFSVDFASNFYRAMVLMTVASPCALVISTPASFISAIASAARGGVLFKGGAYLEALASVKAVAFDKTGTLTKGKPALTDAIPAENVSETELLRIAAATEMRSEHPLAKAVVAAASARGIEVPEPTEFEAVMGRGVRAVVDGAAVHVGSPAYMLETLTPSPSPSGRGEMPSPQTLFPKGEGLPAALEAARHELETAGKTVMLVRRGDAWMGMIALADEVRAEAKAVIERLHKAGVTVAMLTGDNPRVAHTVAAALGVDKVYAGLMPADKVTVIREIEKQYGAVAMVGDGVNDAPALATASIGMAMGAAGTDVAMETADLVLMGDRLELIPYAIQMSKKARRVVWQNITFSLLVIVVLIISTFVISLPLPLGVLGHEGSTVIVVLNGLIQLLLLPEVARRRAG